MRKPKRMSQSNFDVLMAGSEKNVAASSDPQSKFLLLAATCTGQDVRVEIIRYDKGPSGMGTQRVGQATAIGCETTPEDHAEDFLQTAAFGSLIWRSPNRPTDILERSLSLRETHWSHAQLHVLHIHCKTCTTTRVRVKSEPPGGALSSCARPKLPQRASHTSTWFCSSVRADAASRALRLTRSGGR